MLDPDLRSFLRNEVLETHLRDNVQAWRLESDATYRRLKPGKDENVVNSQDIMIRRYGR